MNKLREFYEDKTEQQKLVEAVLQAKEDAELRERVLEKISKVEKMREGK